MSEDVLVQWALAILVCWCVFLVFWLRKHQKDYALFSFYLLTISIASSLRFAVWLNASSKTYFFVYWATQGVTLVVLLCVALGVVFCILGPFRPNLWPAGVLILSVSISIGFLATLLNHVGPNANPRSVLTNSFTVIQQVVVAVSFSMMGCALIAARILSVDCGTRLYGIIVGLTAECFMNSAFLRFLGVMGSPSAHRTTIMARLVAEAIWLYCFMDVRPDVKRLSAREQEDVLAFLRVAVSDSRKRKGDEERINAVSRMSNAAR